jgi:HPt (histidine-containing phosphotransfer) domain-containing protein
LHRWLRPSKDEVAPAPVSYSAPVSPRWQKGKLVGIDSRALDNILAINQDNGYDVLARVINLYIDNSNELMVRLAESLNCRDFPAIGAAAHRLTSSSATLGAQKLAALCRQLEIICQGQFTEKAGSMFLHIKIEHNRVCQTLTGIMNNSMIGPLGTGNELQ